MSELEAIIDARVRAIVAEEFQRRGVGPAREERLLYTVPEASRLTSIGPDTLRRWIEEKKLPRRLKNPLAPKKVVFLVSLDEIRAVSAGQAVLHEPEPTPVNLAAARILRKSR